MAKDFSGAARPLMAHWAQSGILRSASSRVAWRTMLGAVLRLSGSKKSLTQFLHATGLEPLSIYWKRQLRFERSKRPSSVNGCNISVSSSSGLDVAAQIRDAARFIRRHEAEFRRIRRLGLSAVIDFGVEARDKDGPTYFRFPGIFVALLAKNGLDLEVSYYGEPPK
jgi:hypothetical protein